MAFRIMLVGSDKPDPVDAIYARDNAGQVYDFETGPEAQAIAKQLSASGDERKWRVKRVLDHRWKTREAMKFDNGVYTHVPWHGTSWWDACRDVHKHHFAHVSRSEPGMMAYTESPEKGMDNKQTQIKPGRYLEKYFGEVLRIYGISIKHVVAEFDKMYKPRPVHFAKTEDEIQWVYEHGPRSCMSTKAYRREQGWGFPTPGEWPKDIHACRLYAAGDLQVAYLTQSGKPTGRVEARALVWPEKKTHSRCYGQDAALRNQLALLGYKPDPPIGAKIQRIPIQVHGQNLFICPYIDIGQRAGAGATAVKDMKTHLQIVIAEPGSYAANSTSGLCGSMYGRDMTPMRHYVTHCQCCGDHTDDAGELYRVYRSHNQAECLYWCDDCVNNWATSSTGAQMGAYICQMDGNMYSREHMPPIEMANGQTWSPRAFRSSGFRSDANGLNYPRTQRVRLATGECWHYEHFQNNGFTCWYSGDHYPNSERVDIGHGRIMSKAAFRHFGFHCESCGKAHAISDRMRPRGLCPTCTSNELQNETRLRAYRVPSIPEEYGYER